MTKDLQKKKKRFFISPLDWGLGHASRMVPLIQEIHKQGHEVLLGVDLKSAAFLKEIFPTIPQIPLKGYEIRYNQKYLAWKLFWQIPHIKWAIIREHDQLRKIVHKHQIDVVISDSRFGLWTAKTQNFIISHQLRIQYPKNLAVLGKLLNVANHVLINQFDRCLIPDHTNRYLSENLSRNASIRKTQFIGQLSRFSAESIPSNLQEKEKLVFVLSGPEPQRSIFENQIIVQLKTLDYEALIVAGQPEQKYSIQIKQNILKVSHLSDEILAKELVEAKCVFSRSGYSSLMDYSALGLKNVILVPTPGQTEQIYLAENLLRKNVCFAQSQKQFSIVEALKQSDSYTGFAIQPVNNFLLRDFVSQF
ncbi:MAG: hypothetical protein JW729_08895 [Bacteroidales bacterium]|nr:hypothetical protein [Bacteroidales bacterium]